MRTLVLLLLPLLGASAALIGAAEPLPPPELERVPQDAAFFAHVRVGDLLQSPVAADLRKKMPAQFALGEKAFSALTGTALDQLETVSFYWPSLTQQAEAEDFVVILTTKEPYDREALLKRLPKLDKPKNAELHAITPNYVVHFTTPRTVAVMGKGVAEAYLKPTKKDGPQRDALNSAAAKESTAFLSLNFALFPDEIRNNVPPQLRPLVPLFETKALRIAANVGSSIEVIGRADAADKATALDTEDAVKVLFGLFDTGVESFNDRLKRDDEAEQNQAYLDLLASLQKMYQGAKIERKESTVTATMTFPATFAFDKLAATILRDTTGAGQNARTRSTNNLKQIALAMHNYSDTHNGFPPAAVCDKKGKPLLSWRVLILPYIEQQVLYNEFKLDEPWDSEHNKKLLAKMPKTYAPIDGKEGEFKTRYRLFVGGGAAFDYVKGSRFQDITDGTSNTIMAVEAAEAVEWTKPDELAYDATKPVPKIAFPYNKRGLIALMDGSVRAISETIDEKILRLLITPNDGNVVPDF